MDNIEKWIQDTVADLTEKELQLLFDDIQTLRETESLPKDCPLKRLEEYFCTQADDIFSKMVEQVLYRLAGEFVEICKTNAEASVEGWRSAALQFGQNVCLVHNSATPALWDYGVFIDDVYGAALGYFTDEASALRFITEHRYKCANNGKPVDY